MLRLFSCEPSTARKSGLDLNRLKFFANEHAELLVSAVGPMCVDKSNIALGQLGSDVVARL